MTAYFTNQRKLRITRLSFLHKILSAIGLFGIYQSCKKEDIDGPAESIRVYMVKNGTVKDNIMKLFELLGGISRYVDTNDVIVLKCNGQWPNQGYTNTECIKYVIEEILSIDRFSGEILICDNIQGVPDDETRGFRASIENRRNNWQDHNWNSLTEEFRSKNKPVGVLSWKNDYEGKGISGPSEGQGWVRSFFSFHDKQVFLSYPVFESPVTPGKIIDMKNGVWENGHYTGQKVKTIFMPTLNNHGCFSEDYAGITSAVKCFFGATEIIPHQDGTISHNGKNCFNIHSATYTSNNAYYAGELAARFIKTIYNPVLYITCAIWSGYESRTGAAQETKTVLACENPATLDYVSCKWVISPFAPWLDPDLDNNTRKQILGCTENGVGTIEKDKFEIISYEFI